MADTPSMTRITVRMVKVAEIIDLRHRILRAGLPVKTAHFEGDDDRDTHHYAAFLADEPDKLVGCASFMLRMYDRIPAWQLRGMATEQEYQGQGIGQQLLTVVQKDIYPGSEYQYARVQMMWCNARQPAIKFYEKNGWVRASKVFDIATAGPHIVMTKDI